MSRINRTDPISGLIKSLSVSQKSSDTERASTEQTTGSRHSNELEKLKAEITEAIKGISTKETKNRDAVRKILINKMIQWRFSSVISNAAHMSYLVNTVNQTIEHDSDANEQLNQLIDELTS